MPVATGTTKHPADVLTPLNIIHNFKFKFIEFYMSVIVK